MRKTIILVASMVAALVLASGTALAVEPYGTLDANDLDTQSNETFFLGAQERGQTFVAEHSGQVTGLQLVLYDPYALTDTVRPGVDVLLYSISNPFEAQGGEIHGKLLGGRPFVAVPAIPAPVPVELISPPPTVRAGQHYAIVVVAADENWPEYYWEAHSSDLDSSTDAYPNGMAIASHTTICCSWFPWPSTDFLFSVHVNQRPSITELAPTPGSTVGAHRPIVAATVKDLETDLKRSNISLFVDGKRIERTSFAYDASTDRLSYQPPTRLPSGKHAVMVVATDERDFAKTKQWSFAIG